MRRSQTINQQSLMSKVSNVRRRTVLFSLLFVVPFVAVFGREQSTGKKSAAQNFASAANPDSQNNQRLHVYVHYDYMVAADGSSDAPDPAAIELVRQAFDAHGIDLVIDSHHSAIPLWPMVDFGGDTGDCVPPDRTISFETLKAQYFHPTSAHEWHYAIFGERNNCFQNTGIAWIPGDDFFISLGQFRDRLAGLPRDMMLRWVAGTFMHELGHNLGLRHGGNEDQNYKPNYLSVMNYSFISSGIPFASAPGSVRPAGFRVDYSTQALPTLDENHLDETLGINAGTTDITVFVNELGEGIGPASGAIDWNLNGISTERDVRANLTRVDDGDYTLLAGFDDWSFVRGVLSGRIAKDPRKLADENRAHEPTVDSIDPATGTSLGGTSVTIHGMHLNKVDRVLFGSVPASSFRIIDVQTIIAISPPGSGTVNVSVGSGPNLSPGIQFFTYLRPVILNMSSHSGPVGTVITIHGERLATARSVEFRGTDGPFSPDFAAAFTVVDDNTLTVIAQTPGCQTDSLCLSGNGPYVIVTTDAFGANEIVEHCCSEMFFAGRFVITAHPRPIPTITSITPSSAWAAVGLTTVEIKGTGFRYLDERGVDQPNVVLISFGGAPATNLVLWDSETVLCNAPGRTSGTVDVRVWSFFGESPITAADRFMYASANGLFLNQFALQHTITPATATPWFPVGNYISYWLFITNPMQADATSVVLTDVLPPETTLVACNSNRSDVVCGGSGNNLTVNFSLIPYGVPAGVSVLVRVNDNVAPGALITNTASFTSLSPDPDLSDNTTTTTVMVPIPPPPSICGLTPTSGPESGGTSVLIQGSGFLGATTVKFGLTNALTFTIVDDNDITALAPPGTGTVDVTVSNLWSTSTLRGEDRFTYLQVPPSVTSVSPNSGPAAGFTPITIRGSGFSGATSVSVGPYGIASFKVIDDTTITAVTNPAGALGPGTFDVTVTNAGGTSSINSNDRFTYF